MAIALEIGRTALATVVLHKLRSLVTIACLLTVLVPFLTGLGLSKGLEREAELSVREGADLYVTARQFDRNVPIPFAAIQPIQAIPGVDDAIPRIVGGIVLGKDNASAVLVGMPREKFPTSIQCIDGELSRDSRFNELVVGADLARRLNLKVGSVIPPFYRSDDGERISKVVGIFASDVGIWQANVIFTTFETAAHIMNQHVVATDLLVYCRPGYQEQVAESIQSLTLSAPHAPQPLRPHVVARDEVASLFRGGLTHREGIFNLHFTLAFAVAILVLLVTSGLGLPERRREIAILKATGWQTDQILLRSTVECLVLATIGICIAVILSFVWLRWLNGYWIASVFLAGVDTAPRFPVPFTLTPVPVLLAFLIGLTVALTGTLYSSWRSAIAAPMDAMR
ncbi:MAG TPA: FtsX-like permease family protein [Gemmataceae bacterium]|jgi:ABC-type lipoprotein release transport system permease subunit|nr:FtsX-like permease family protein [Gemmataceae bacterium]